MIKDKSSEENRFLEQNAKIDYKTNPDEPIQPFLNFVWLNSKAKQPNTMSKLMKGSIPK